MKKQRKFKDEYTRKDSKKEEKRFSKTRKARFKPSDHKRAKYRIKYINEEE